MDTHNGNGRPELHGEPSGIRTPQISAPGDGLVVFSGGTAANSLVDVFEHVRAANKCTLSYVIPISDNGGSTSEVIRVFGGPGTSHSPRASQRGGLPHTYFIEGSHAGTLPRQRWLTSVQESAT